MIREIGHTTYLHYCMKQPTTTHHNQNGIYAFNLIKEEGGGILVCIVENSPLSFRCEACSLCVGC